MENEQPTSSHFNEQPLPPGWSKQWSNSWKKHYWFNATTGKQSWEHPGRSGGNISGGGAEGESATGKAPEHAKSATGEQAATAGEKRKAPETAHAAHAASKVPKEGAGGSAVTEAKAASASPTKKPPPAVAGGGLASILGSIQSQTKAPTAKELEIRKKKKEAEEARVAEVKAERENYKAWVGFQLNSFLEEGREYYEFPPSDSVHRIIAKDEAEERGFVAFSHGEKEEEKRVYVFPDGKGPNELESRFLKHAGTVQELVERRARGDTFKEYNTAFSMLDAKLITKTRVRRGGDDGDRDDADQEDEIQSRMVNDRNFDTKKAKEIANQLHQAHEARKEQADLFLHEDND